MLYVTTRSNREVFTPQRALRENRGPDGGLYVPYHTPAFDRDEMAALLELPENECICQVLNRLFRTELTPLDVDYAVGRHPIRLHPLPHRVYVGETWHNPRWDYDHAELSLAQKLGVSLAGDWTGIAVRIAVLAGMFSQLRAEGVEEADVAVVSGDFSGPASVLYARQWGMPIRNIICCCNENRSLWDLICHGQMRTNGVSVPTSVPEADVAIPEDLERLIHLSGGERAVAEYLDCCRAGRPYAPSEGLLTRMREGLFVSVVSSQRLETTIPSVFRSHRYLLSPHTALAYGGLLDYRAKTGKTGHAVVWSEKSPQLHQQAIAQALGVAPEEVKRILL